MEKVELIKASSHDLPLQEKEQPQHLSYEETLKLDIEELESRIAFGCPALNGGISC